MKLNKKTDLKQNKQKSKEVGLNLKKKNETNC